MSSFESDNKRLAFALSIAGLLVAFAGLAIAAAEHYADRIGDAAFDELGRRRAHTDQLEAELAAERERADKAEAELAKAAKPAARSSSRSKPRAGGKS